jgi:hypothetical protein
MLLFFQKLYAFIYEGEIKNYSGIPADLLFQR